MCKVQPTHFPFSLFFFCFSVLALSVKFSCAISLFGSFFLCCGNLFDIAAEPLTRIDCPQGQKTASGLKDKRQALLWARTLLARGWPSKWTRNRHGVRWMGRMGVRVKKLKSGCLSTSLSRTCTQFFALWLSAIDSTLIFHVFPLVSRLSQQIGLRFASHSAVYRD